MLGSSPPATTTDQTSMSTDHELVVGKKNRNMSCRRFSDEQIKSLESVFKRENKLEPRKKLEMARELGLHPRQVAIWFQNRRARWKSKQVEQDYNNLKADYDTLSHRFHSLKKEKHDLLHQLSNLCSQLKEPHEIIKDLDSGSEAELNGFSRVLEHDMAIYSDEDDSVIPIIKEEMDNNMQEGADKELEEITNRHENTFDQLGSLNFDDHSCSNWWDIWSSNARIEN